MSVHSSLCIQFYEEAGEQETCVLVALKYQTKSETACSWHFVSKCRKLHLENWGLENDTIYEHFTACENMMQYSV